MKGIDPREGLPIFGWLKVTFVKQYEEEKYEEYGAIFMNTWLSRKLLGRFLSVQIWYVGLHIWRT